MSPPISQNHNPHQCLNFLSVEIDEPKLLRVTRQEQEVAKGTSFSCQVNITYVTPLSQNQNLANDLNYLSVEIDEPELLRVTRQEQQVAKGTYSDLHVYQVTCLQIGITKVTFVVGNNPSATNT